MPSLLVAHHTEEIFISSLVSGTFHLIVFYSENFYSYKLSVMVKISSIFFVENMFHEVMKFSGINLQKSLASSQDTGMI